MSAADQKPSPSGRPGVIVVLGAAVRSGGRPSLALLRRITHACRLYRNGVAPYLLLTGGVVKHPPSEASLMKRMAVELGVPESAILLDEESRSTWESALNCARIISARGLGPALIVSDGFHMRRALFLFRRARIECTGDPAPFPGGRSAVWHLWYHHARETVAFMHWWARS